MKSLVIAAAVLVGGAGIATAQTPPGTGITNQGTNPEGQPCSPPGFNQGLSVYPPCEALPTPPSQIENYPPCTRQNADRCVQTYERGVRRR